MSKKKSSAAPGDDPALPAPAPSKSAVELAAEEPAAAATRRLLLILLDQIVVRRDGVLRGDDPEEVHDFRVAVRRTRSALGQVRGVFPLYRRDKFRAGFAWLAGESNHLRDTDVLIEQLPALAAEVCPEDPDALSPLLEHLRGQREAAQKALAKVLRGEKYRRLVRSWRTFLEKPPRTSVKSAPNAARPVAEVAAERIRAVYRRIRKTTKKFAEPVPAEELHQLRIECKKLRYLLELFRSLFPAGQLAAVLAHLKHLQELLGEMNDLEVQKGRLAELAKQLEAAPAAAIFAMGRIAQRHERRQQVLRKDLESRIDELVHGEARAFFRAIGRGLQ